MIWELSVWLLQSDRSQPVEARMTRKAKRPSRTVLTELKMSHVSEPENTLRSGCLTKDQ
jgi:hypothetical protein